MNCLCCGKPLRTSAVSNQWHRKCIKDFFGTANFPDIDISDDMLSTNVVIPTDQEQLALTMNGKKQNIRRKDFIRFGDAIGLTQIVAEKIMERISKCEETYLDMCEKSYLPDDIKEQLKSLIQQRVSVLRKGS